MSQLLHHRVSACPSHSVPPPQPILHKLKQPPCLNHEPRYVMHLLEIVLLYKNTSQIPYSGLPSFTYPSGHLRPLSCHTVLSKMTSSPSHLRLKLAAPFAWNTLPGDLHITGSLLPFRWRLHYHLLKSSFSDLTPHSTLHHITLCYHLQSPCYTWICWYIGCGLIFGQSGLNISLKRGGPSLLFKTLAPWPIVGAREAVTLWMDR